MKVINWLNLDLDKEILSHVSDSSEKVVHLRTFLKQLIYFLLSKYPWDQRTDTVSIFNPSVEYQQDQIIAYPITDSQGLRPNTWRLGHVVDITDGENLIQGVFQVVTIEIDNRQKQLAANIKGAQSLEFNLSLGDSDDIEWLIGDIVDTYYIQFYQAIVRAISQRNLIASIKGENLILGQLTETLGEIEIKYLQELIGEDQIDELWIDSVDLLAKIRGLGGLEDFTDDSAIHLIEAYLESQGYISAGHNRWILPETLYEIDRSIQVRPKVPVVQSKVIKELRQQEDEKFTDYEEVELEDEGQAALETFGEDDDIKVITSEDWTPPTTPIQLPTITYQNIIEAFFPLSANLRKAFPGKGDIFLVEIQIAQGQPLPFIINQEEGLIKAVDRDHVRQRLLEESIAAGTKLWLEYQHGLTYRIFPKPLAQPVYRKCKIANWDEAGNLTFSLEEIPINYEHEAQIFVAEFRHADPVALFKEAESSGLSIFDALYYSIQELSKLSPNGQVHYFELFNAVFFRHRMCSPRSVITELYSRPCFVAIGDGYFYLDIEKGFRRSGIKKISMSKPQAPKQKRIDTAASGYFIFQQNPKGVSEYQDEPGKIYNWRQGIPGSNQIKANSRFIYYRPREKVFFGIGLLEKIESYFVDDGTEYHNGIITDYESWDPPLIFSKELSEKLSFHDSRRIWIGQMGIRQITKDDFYSITQAYHSTRFGAHTVDDFYLRVLQQLVGKRIFTLDQNKPFNLINVDKHNTIIRTSTGEVRMINNSQIYSAWKELITNNELTRSDIQSKFSDFNPAYIASILSKFPDVNYTKNPIKLSYKQSENRNNNRLTNLSDAERSIATQSIKTIGESFIQEYHSTTGHWALLPRVIYFTESGINGLFKALELLANHFIGKNWNPQTKHEYTIALLENGIVQPRGPLSDVSDAHARIRDNLFRYLGLAFLESDRLIKPNTLSPIGYKFLDTTNLHERNELLGRRLYKLHFWNPVVPPDRYGAFHVIPLKILIQILDELDNKFLSPEEYNMFISRIKNQTECRQAIKQINEYRQLDQPTKDDLVNTLSYYRSHGRTTSLYHEIEQMRKITYGFYSLLGGIDLMGDNLIIGDLKELHRMRQMMNDVEYMSFSSLEKWIDYFGKE
jgi:hypothetical protein